MGIISFLGKAIKGLSAGVLTGTFLGVMKKYPDKLIATGKLTAEEVGICTLFKNEVSLFGINSFAKPTPVVIAFMEMMEKSPNISADEKKKFSDGIDGANESMRKISEL